jgi:hypothetical protein
VEVVVAVVVAVGVAGGVAVVGAVVVAVVVVVLRTVLVAVVVGDVGHSRKLPSTLNSSITTLSAVVRVMHTSIVSVSTYPPMSHSSPPVLPASGPECRAINPSILAATALHPCAILSDSNPEAESHRICLSGSAGKQAPTSRLSTSACLLHRPSSAGVTYTLCANSLHPNPPPTAELVADVVGVEVAVDVGEAVGVLVSELVAELVAEVVADVV